MMRNLMFAAIATAASAGCGGPVADKPVALTQAEAAELSETLATRVPGKPVACLPGYQSASARPIGDQLLIYRSTRRLIYKNELRSVCPGLGRDDDILVSKIYGGGPCRGDIIYRVDRFSGIRGPACVLGDFVPYRLPRSEG